jgi:hypothetical protein
MGLTPLHLTHYPLSFFPGKFSMDEIENIQHILHPYPDPQLLIICLVQLRQPYILAL